MDSSCLTRTFPFNELMNVIHCHSLVIYMLIGAASAEGKFIILNQGGGGYFYMLLKFNKKIYFAEKWDSLFKKKRKEKNLRYRAPCH